MSKTVLILGGRGRIGQAIARDIIQYNQAQVIITGRRANYPENLAALPESVSYQALDLANRSALEAAIWSADLVIHCAGPFHQCDARVLELCLAAQVNYLDVSDHRSYVKKVIPYREAAQAAGVTAVLNTGIFPGVSNSMVRQGVESLDEVKTIHLSYVVAGSGGAGLTIMRTTFLGLQQPFTVWRDHCWQEVLPYSEREEIKFPSPFGQVGVYWFDVPEAFTFVESFPVQEIITKFGSVPEFYNYLTWATTRLLPSSWMKHPLIIEGLSRISYGMTQVTDRFTGEGVAIRVAI
jgi:saccharopine dehydrogenase-like NADP-dependent oxidoreductase